MDLIMDLKGIHLLMSPRSDIVAIQLTHELEL